MKHLVIYCIMLQNVLVLFHYTKHKINMKWTQLELYGNGQAISEYIYIYIQYSFYYRRYPISAPKTILQKYFLFQYMAPLSFYFYVAPKYIW